MSRFKRQENDIVRHNRQMNGRYIEFRELLVEVDQNKKISFRRIKSKEVG